MLYDNAQLASVHLLAFELTGDPRWRAEAEATFAFIARTMTSPEGGFYSALDAETEGGEGAYYVWTRDEVKEVLGDGPDAEAFSQVYGLKREPNFEGDRYVLLEPRPRAEQAESLKTTPEALEARLAPLREPSCWRPARSGPRPLRDDKILTAWNGLMIAAYADGYRVLKDERLPPGRREGRRLRPGHSSATPTAACCGPTAPARRKLPAYLEDYAFLVHGLLRLHAADRRRPTAGPGPHLTDRMIADFADDQDGGFFFTADDHESLLARPKDPLRRRAARRQQHGRAQPPRPAPGRPGETRYLDLAGKTLDAFSTSLAQNPAAMPIMLVGLLEYLDVTDPAGRITAGPLADGSPAAGTRPRS